MFCSALVSFRSLVSFISSCAGNVCCMDVRQCNVKECLVKNLLNHSPDALNVGCVGWIRASAFRCMCFCWIDKCRSCISRTHWHISVSKSSLPQAAPILFSFQLPVCYARPINRYNIYIYRTSVHYMYYIYIYI